MRQQITALMERMKQEHIDYYLVVSEDDHNSEYVAPHFRVIAYLTGFTGSAGTLLVSRSHAYLWTDGRYFLQAENQLKASGITLMRMGEENVPALVDWLAEHGKAGEDIFYGHVAVSKQCLCLFHTNVNQQITKCFS